MERGWTLFQSGVVLCKRCLAEVGSLLTGSQLVKWVFFPGGQRVASLCLWNQVLTVVCAYASNNSPEYPATSNLEGVPLYLFCSTGRLQCSHGQ